MRSSLTPGLTQTLRFTVSRDKTVPFLYPEAPSFVAMPEVFATGFMVGLMEWCCIEAIAPHLDPGEGSVGVLIEVTHEAATPPGMTVSVECLLERVDGRQLFFQVTASDERELIGRGRHGRAVVLWEKFNARLAKKTARRI